MNGQGDTEDRCTSSEEEVEAEVYMAVVPHIEYSIQEPLFAPQSQNPY